MKKKDLIRTVPYTRPEYSIQCVALDRRKANLLNRVSDLAELLIEKLQITTIPSLD